MHHSLSLICCECSICQTQKHVSDNLKPIVFEFFDNPGFSKPRLDTLRVLLGISLQMFITYMDIIDIVFNTKY